MSEYQQLTKRFAEVRRAWKRTTALSGLAVVVTEGIGVLTVLLFLDWLYQPHPAVRIGMGAIALGVLIWFLFRQVVRPLTRFIPDEQIALYIEEHRNDLDGILITAAEYGKRREQVAGGQGALIDVVVNEAASRARTTTRGVIDLSRLRKYGIAALAGIVIYIVLGVLFPNAVAHHVGRILNPWHATVEDLPARPTGPALLEPIKFTLSKGDASLQRGTSFDFEATLSRHPDKPVTLNFRPVVQGTEAAWQPLPMTEIEKLNGFQGTLSDVSEDLEFYVSCGDDKSETHRLTVFDPLVIQSLEVTTHYPDYTKLVDRVEKQSSGDVEALIGSTVTVRIVTSNPLKEGQIKWNAGQTQPLTVDPQSDKAAAFSFEVKADDTYDYALTDANGQKAASVASLTVKAIPDKPPTVAVKSPVSPALTNVLGEVNFEVDADDDFGVAGADLVLSRLDENSEEHETRVPLTFVPGDTKASANAVHSSYKLMLEKGNPLFKPDDALAFHVEVRDSKGQVTSSDLGMIIVGYFENWATWELPHGPHSPHQEPPDLMAMLSMVWLLHGQKATLAPADFQEQSKQIAGKMVDESGAMVSYVDLEHMPQLARIKPKIEALAEKAHTALLAADTATAANDLRIAAILYAGNSVLNTATLAQHLGGGDAGHFSAPTLTLLEKARLDAMSQSATDKTQSSAQKESAAATAAATSKIDELLKKQEGVIAAAKAPARAQSPKDQSSLASTQKGIAEETKALADKATGASDTSASKLGQASGKAGAAAKAMEAAARDFEAGNTAEGAAKAEAARKALADARDALQGTNRDKLEMAISDAASKLDALIEKQRTLRGDTETTAKELDNGKTPDQRQKRDLEKQAYQETGMQVEAQTVIASISDLNEWAAQVGEAEAIRALGEATKTSKRVQPEGKMADAIIDLNNGTAAPAVAEQQAAEDGLAKILADLHEGSDALAASRDAQLRRAQRTADAAAKGLQALAQSHGQQTKAGQSGAQSKAGQAGAEAKAGEAGAQAKAGEAGAQAKAGEAGAQSQSGGQSKTDAESETPANGGGPSKLAYDIQRLTTTLDNRDLVPQKDVDQLKQLTMSEADLAKRLVVDPKLLHDVSELVGSIDDKLEAATAAKTEASKLFSSQREECPPEYRVFVNQYFEALSKVNGQPAVPGEAGQPGEPGQSSQP